MTRSIVASTAGLGHLVKGSAAVMLLKVICTWPPEPADAVVRKVLLASAAIPGAFSPVLFDVTLDGQLITKAHEWAEVMSRTGVRHSVLTQGAQVIVLDPVNLDVIAGQGARPRWQRGARILRPWWC